MTSDADQTAPERIHVFGSGMPVGRLGRAIADAGGRPLSIDPGSGTVILDAGGRPTELLALAPPPKRTGLAGHTGWLPLVLAGVVLLAVLIGTHRSASSQPAHAPSSSSSSAAATQPVAVGDPSPAQQRAALRAVGAVSSAAHPDARRGARSAAVENPRARPAAKRAAAPGTPATTGRGVSRGNPGAITAHSGPAGTTSSTATAVRTTSASASSVHRPATARVPKPISAAGPASSSPRASDTGDASDPAAVGATGAVELTPVQ